LQSANTATVFGDNDRGMQIGPNGGTFEVLNSVVTIWSSSIRKVPGTATRVTLTKTGIGEFRYNGNATAGQTRHDTDFDQVVVNAGLFRLGSVSGQDTELGFGLAPAVPTSDAIVLNGGAIGTSFGSTLHANRGITLGANGGVLNLVGGAMTIPSVISGAGTLRIIGTQGLTLSGTNTYTGNTIIGSDITMIGGVTPAVAGAVSISADANLGQAPAVPTANNISLGTATAAGTLTVTQDATIDSNRGISIGAGGGTLSASTGKTATYGGVLAGAGGLTKAGAGTWVLTGNNTYGGTTTVSAGKLFANNTSGTATSGGAVTIQNTATLGGTGAVAGGVTIQTGGTIAPGANAIGTLGTGALSVGGTFQWEIDTTNPGTPLADLLNANGNLSLTGSTLFTDDLAATPQSLAATQKLTLISYAGTWDGSTFGGIADGGTVAIDGKNFTIDYNDTSAGANGGLYTKFVTATPAAGDYTGDTFVNAADYVTWRKDANNIGGGDPQGYIAWRENFMPSPIAGPGLGASDLGPAAVPEPASVALVMIGLALVAAGRRRTHRRSS
jgi:autotransporter-associated beta strand protein